MSLTATETTKVGPRRWLIASVLLLAAFMNLLDGSIVNLALPAIQADLNATSTQLQWVMVIYILTFAAGLLPFGRFGDVFGRDRMFIWGMLGFMFTSAACGLAPNVEALIASRALKGLAAAMMVPQVLAIIHVVFPADEKGKVIGLFGMVSGLGAVAGPLIGGLLVSADVFGLGWRPIFLINLPLGLVSLTGALVLLPKVKASTHASIDWIGSALFASAIVALTYPLIEGRSLGWPVWAFGLMAFSLVLGWAFLGHQKKLAATGRLQTLPVSLVKDGPFVGGLIIVTLFFAGIAGVILLLSVFLQSGFGFTPAEAGIALAPHPASAMIVSLMTGRLGAKFLKLRVFVGALALLAGMIWLQSIAGQADANLQGTDVLVPLLFVGAGMGASTVALFQSILSRVAGPDAGAGSGVLQAFQQVGIALGIAIIGQIFFAGLGANPDHTSFSAAAKTALWFPIGIYGLLGTVCACQLLPSKGSSK
ncbi:MAG: MFS transporter [Pelagimonas sp.]|uniref:MFS transporter n=1 Tax=Pelagimonas sp. TaxID=2073170 RepID=UPI003D6BED9D